MSGPQPREPGDAEVSMQQTRALRRGRRGAGFNSTCCNWSSQNENDSAVNVAFQIMEGVFDVLCPAKFTRPAAVGQLPGRVGWEAPGIGKQGDFFKPGLVFLVQTGDVPQAGEGSLERLHGLQPDHTGRPEDPTFLPNRPPPIVGDTGRPGLTVVAPIRRAGDQEGFGP